MAQGAFKQEFEALAARMLAATNFDVANDAGPAASRSEISRALESRLRLWCAAIATGIDEYRSVLAAFTQAGDEAALRHACDEVLPKVADKIDSLLLELDNDATPEIPAPLFFRIRDLRDGVLALIWDFDPDSHVIEGTATTDEEIEAFIFGLPYR